MAPSDARRRQSPPGTTNTGLAVAEHPQDGEAAGAELGPWDTPQDPMELQVDLQVKPVAAARPRLHPLCAS